jgi:hypothetical protein
VAVLSVLLDDFTTAPRYIFRSLINQQARIEIMRNLLQNTARNAHLDSSFDEILNEFASLNHIRNGYAHGIWHSKVEARTAHLAEPMGDHWFFLKYRRVTKKELLLVGDRMAALLKQLTILDFESRRDWQRLNNPTYAEMSQEQFDEAFPSIRKALQNAGGAPMPQPLSFRP